MRFPPPLSFLSSGVCVVRFQIRSSMAALDVRREEEFAPVKNGQGNDQRPLICVSFLETRNSVSSFQHPIWTMDGVLESHEDRDAYVRALEIVHLSLDHSSRPQATTRPPRREPRCSRSERRLARVFKNTQEQVIPK